MSAILVSRGGRIPGAGRKPGVPNKVTLERERMLAADGIMPLDYMLKVLRSDKEPDERRSWAAEKAAPYCHPRLAAVEHTGKDGGAIQHAIKVTFIKPPNAGQ